MAAMAEGKYQLRSLHEEIDLFDRKLTHLLKFESFATDSTRDAAAKKLKNRRDLLAKTARRLASEGVEFLPNELPRSFREEDAAGIDVAALSAPEPIALVATKKRAVKAPVVLPAAPVEVQAQAALDS